MKSIEKNFQFIKTVILPSLLGAGLMTLAVMLWTSTEDPISLHADEQHLQTDGEAFVVIVEGDRTLVRPLEEVLDELLQARSVPDSAVMAAVLRSSKPDGIPHNGTTGIEL
jgi:hypothetical protein